MYIHLYIFFPFPSNLCINQFLTADRRRLLYIYMYIYDTHLRAAAVVAMARHLFSRGTHYIIIECIRDAFGVSINEWSGQGFHFFCFLVFFKRSYQFFRQQRRCCHVIFGDGAGVVSVSDVNEICILCTLCKSYTMAMVPSQ